MNYDKLLTHKQFMYHIGRWSLEYDLGTIRNEVIVIRNFKFEVIGKGLIIRRGQKLQYSGQLNDFLKRFPNA